MARALRTKTNVQAPDSDYTFGRIKDDDGSNNGTPVNELVYGDMHQFFEKLMLDGGTVFNGFPENAYSGFQFNQALDAINGGNKKKTVDIGDWNMDSTTSVLISLPTGVTYDKIRGVKVSIRTDLLTGSYQIDDLIANGAGSYQVNPVGLDPTHIQLTRVGGGTFDNTTYDSTAYNRGWIIIEYTS